MNHKENNASINFWAEQINKINSRLDKIEKSNRIDYIDIDELKDFQTRFIEITKVSTTKKIINTFIGLTILFVGTSTCFLTYKFCLWIFG